MANSGTKAVQNLSHSLPQFVTKIKTAARDCQATKLGFKPLLNGNFSLRNIEDVEAFCGRVIERAGLELSYHDSEDLLTFLIESAWELSLAYERGNPAFTDTYFPFYAKRMLGLRVIDWQRSRNGRTRWANPNRKRDGRELGERAYERVRPIVISIEDRPDSPDPSLEVDLGASGLSDLLGLQRKRSSAVPRRDNGVDKAPARDAARRAARAA